MKISESHKEKNCFFSEDGTSGKTLHDGHRLASHPGRSECFDL